MGSLWDPGTDPATPLYCPLSPLLGNWIPSQQGIGIAWELEAGGGAIFE